MRMGYARQPGQIGRRQRPSRRSTLLDEPLSTIWTYVTWVCARSADDHFRNHLNFDNSPGSVIGFLGSE